MGDTPEPPTDDSAKWLSPHEPEITGWARSSLPAAVVHRIGLLLYCMGSGLPDPYPQKMGERVVMDLLREVGGSGRAIRPNLDEPPMDSVFLRGVVTACLGADARERLTPDSLRLIVSSA